MSKHPETDRHRCWIPKHVLFYNCGDKVVPVVDASFAEKLELSRNEWKQRYEDLLNESQTKEQWRGKQQQG